MSVLVWRLIHRKLATDDCISAKGIALASKCQCCYPANIETLDHVFFTGQRAVHMWKTMSSIFRKEPPSSTQTMCQVWLAKLNNKTFVNCATILAAVSTLWELWLYRNKRKMENEKQNVFLHVQRWFSKQSGLITGQFGDQKRVDVICRAFQIKTPLLKGNSSILEMWNPWPWGVTCSIHIAKKHNDFYCGSIFRDSRDNFLYACCFKLDQNCIIKALLESVRKIPNLATNITNFQSSNLSMNNIANKMVPWDKLRQWLKLNQMVPKVNYTLVTSSQNNSAMILAYIGQDLSIHQQSDLPIAVFRAVQIDHGIYVSSHGR